MISSDLPEILGNCRRALVMREGRIAGELADAALTEEAAIRLAMLLLQAPAAEDGGRTAVAADSRGVSYAVFAPDGSLEDADDDWEPLVRRLETNLADPAPAATVFWP